ncbi:hypothetical protein HAV15_004543 [Penicillium sp. str. |nr:hypothetical protein HAV15_004543 [Penicillium sp. str. \
MCDHPQLSTTAHASLKLSDNRKSQVTKMSPVRESNRTPSALGSESSSNFSLQRIGSKAGLPKSEDSFYHPIPSDEDSESGASQTRARSMPPSCSNSPLLYWTEDISGLGIRL